MGQSSQTISSYFPTFPLPQPIPYDTLTSFMVRSVSTQTMNIVVGSTPPIIIPSSAAATLSQGPSHGLSSILPSIPP